METLEVLTRRIRATEDLQSLVRSMKTLSAVSVRQLEHAEASLREFRRTIDLGLQAVLREYEARAGQATGKAQAEAIVVFGSDRGLCGNFNETVAELAARHLARHRPSGVSIHVVAVGAQAAARMESLGITPREVCSLPGSVHGLAEACERVLIRIDGLRQTAGVGRVETIFNRRDEEGEIGPSAHVLLPIGIDHMKDLARRRWPARRLPTHTTGPGELFSWLVRQHLFASLYQAGLSSMASENAARLAAMQRAERNISDHLVDMTADYRRLRQDAITTELMDIIGGYEALQKAAPRRL